MSVSRPDSEESSQEPPVLPDSGASPEASVSGKGLRDEPDTWQVSNLPEEKTYFGMDVSLRRMNVES